VCQEDAERQSEQAASDERECEKAKHQETVETRDRQSASGHQDGDGETERDQDGHRGGHDVVDCEEAQLSDESKGAAARTIRSQTGTLKMKGIASRGW
jgi:hypothetical protein